VKASGLRLHVERAGCVRGIFGPEVEEITEGRRKMHNKNNRNLNASPNITSMIKSRMGWACNMHEIDEKCIQNFDIKSEGKK
jgi:hypothetical protein